LIALIINAHPIRSFIGLLGETQQRSACGSGTNVHSCRRIIDLARANFRSRGRSLEKPALLQDRTDGAAVRLANKNTAATRTPKGPCHDNVWRVARTVSPPGQLDLAAPRSPGTISSSRCQTTRTSRHPVDGTHTCANLFSYGRAICRSI
jgi:hypothetical protein